MEKAQNLKNERYWDPATEKNVKLPETEEKKQEQGRVPAHHPNDYH